MKSYRAAWMAVWCVLFTFSAGLVVRGQANAPAAVSPADPKIELTVAGTASAMPLSTLTVGSLFRDDDQDGYGDILVPVVTWEQGLLFINPRTSFGEEGEREFNIGTGGRVLVPGQDIILGANVFYDNRNTDRGYCLDQFGFGLECLTVWVDARFNYYLPQDDRKVYDTQTVEQQAEIARYEPVGDDPYAAGDQILQETATKVSYYTRYTRNVYVAYDYPMEGYDWEVGFKVPLPACVPLDELKVFGGSYSFEADGGDGEAKGWKSRVEARFMSSFYLDAGWFENKELTGSDYFAGARWQSAFDFERLVEFRNPFVPFKAQRPFRSRLADMVVRDMNVRRSVSGYERSEEKSSTREVKTGSELQDRTTYVLLDDVQFVSNTAPAGGNGTAESPRRTIQGGVSNVYGARNVYVYAGSGPYNENVTLPDGVTLWGEGRPVPGFFGKYYGGGAYPTVNGDDTAPGTVVVGRDVTVRGMRITSSGLGTGIYGPAANNITLDGNIVEQNRLGVILHQDGDTVNVITGNRIVNNPNGGLVLVSDGGGSGTLMAKIHGNQFNTNGSYGAVIVGTGYDVAVASLFDNQANDNDGAGMAAIFGGGRIGLLCASKLTADNNRAFGLSLGASATNGIAAAVVGADPALYTLVDESASLLGMPLPAIFTNLLGTGGPVEADGNLGQGMAVSVSGRQAALALLFDVSADNNLGVGLTTDVFSDQGIAAGIVAASDPVMEIASLLGNGLGALIPGLPWPAIPDLPDHHNTFNNNMGAGAVVSVHGATAGIGAVLGAEADNNGAGGLALDVHSSNGVAIAAGARVETANNLAGNGTSLAADGADLALVAALDIRSSNNRGNGLYINSTSFSGAALALVAATDPLWTLQDVVNANTGLGLDIFPGHEAFGPVTLDNNLLDGLSMEVAGRDLALGAVLDTVATGNGGAGMVADIDSTEGDAIGAFLSTDTIFNNPALLTEVLSVSNAPVIPSFTAMGPMDVSSNRINGLMADISGGDTAFGIFGGIRADDTLMGDGFNLAVHSVSNDATLAAGWLTANSNAMNGLEFLVEAGGEADAILVQSDFSRNRANGMVARVVSTNDGSYMIAGGVAANANRFNGVDITLVATQETALALSAVTANGNGNDGIKAALAAGTGNAYIWASDHALDDYIATLHPVHDYPDALLDTVPRGSLTANSNGGTGILLDAKSGSDVMEEVVSAEVRANGADGLVMVAEAPNYLNMTFSYPIAVSNAGNGVWMQVQATNSSVVFGSWALADLFGNGGDNIVVDMNGGHDVWY